MRNILGQWKPTITLTDLVAKKQVLIVRLPKGSLGEDHTSLVGGLVVSGILQAVMSPAAKRVPHYLHIDEFQSVATDSLQMVFSESRKFGLALTAGHQFLDQLSPPLLSAVFGNVGNLVAFRVGGPDSERLARECRGIAASRFAELERGQVIARLLSGGETSSPIIGFTSPPTSGVGTYRRVIAKSRRAFGRPRSEVEGRIGRWLRR